MKGLEEWVRLYTALTGIVDPQQASYLKRTADTAKQFKANYEALSKHLETPRPGEKGFPGANVEQWQRYLTESYTQLLTLGPPAAPRRAGPAPALPAAARLRDGRGTAAAAARLSRRLLRLSLPGADDRPDVPPGGADARQHVAAPGADRAPPGRLREPGRAEERLRVPPRRDVHARKDEARERRPFSSAGSSPTSARTRTSTPSGRATTERSWRR